MKKILLSFAAFFLMAVSINASADNGEYKMAFGITTPNAMFESTKTTVLGWNEFNFSEIPATSTISLVDSNGASSSVTMSFSNLPVCANGNVTRLNYAGLEQNGAGYPASVSTDYFQDAPRSGNCGAGNYGDGITQMLFTGLNPSWTYTVKVLSLYKLGPSNLRMTIGSQSVTTDSIGVSTTTTVQINNATTTATSSMYVTFTAIRDDTTNYTINAVEIVANTGNAAPVVDAGPDVTITAPASSISLNGTATDSDGTIATTTWELFSGPGGTITSTSSLNTTATGLYPGKYSFRLYATDNFGKKVMDEKIVTVLPDDFSGTAAAKKIVIIGGSISYGWGASPINSDVGVKDVNSWAKMYEYYLKMQNPNSVVINTSIAGYTSSQEATSTIAANTIGNAVAQSPDAIVIFTSTNDPTSGISTSTTIANLAYMVNYANAAGIPVWIQTPTPRFGTTATQTYMKNYVLSAYPTRSVDFHSDLNDGSGIMATPYNSGDGIHPNNLGHSLLYKRMISAKIFEKLQATTTAPASVVALSGDSTATLNWSAPVSNGGAVITGYKVYSAASSTLVATTSADVTSLSIPGLVNDTPYSYYVTATNIVGESSSSSAVSVTPAAPVTVSSAPFWSPGSSSSGSSGIPTSLVPFINQPAVPAVRPTTAAALPAITPASFPRSLAQGARGDDVKRLQQYLNAKGFPVAPSGVGSKGKETSLFGPATRAALVRFQKAMKITPAVGFFGPLTRAAIK